MPSINTTYGPSGTTTATTGGGFMAPPSLTPQIPQAGGGGAIQDALRRKMAIEAARERDAARMREMQMRAMGMGMQREQEQYERGRNEYMQRGNQGGEGRNNASPLSVMESYARMQELQSATGPAPMRGVTGFNQIGSAGGQDVMDVNAMSGIQRRAFLPSNSQVSNGGFSANAPAAEPWDPYQGSRSREEGPDRGVDYRRQQLAAAYGRSNRG